jgi:hypothetical protein
MPRRRVLASRARRSCWATSNRAACVSTCWRSWAASCFSAGRSAALAFSPGHQAVDAGCLTTTSACRGRLGSCMARSCRRRFGGTRDEATRLLPWRASTARQALARAGPALVHVGTDLKGCRLLAMFFHTAYSCMREVDQGARSA